MFAESTDVSMKATEGGAGGMTSCDDGGGPRAKRKRRVVGCGGGMSAFERTAAPQKA